MQAKPAGCPMSAKTPSAFLPPTRYRQFYTMVMREGTEFFCPWSISRVEQVIKSPPFIRTHRSYLVNLRHVTGFESLARLLRVGPCDADARRIRGRGA